MTNLIPDIARSLLTNPGSPNSSRYRARWMMLVAVAQDVAREAAGVPVSPFMQDCGALVERHYPPMSTPCGAPGKPTTPEPAQPPASPTADTSSAP